MEVNKGNIREESSTKFNPDALLISVVEPNHDDPIVYDVNINTKSTLYAGAAGANHKVQPKVTSNFCPLVFDPVFEGVNIYIPRKVVEKVNSNADLMDVVTIALENDEEEDEEHVENVYDESANLFPNSKPDESLTFTVAVGYLVLVELFVLGDISGDLIES
nr:hypothetical protein [Tanacetum cinerariifolium]